MENRKLRTIIIEDEVESLHLLHNLIESGSLATVTVTVTNPAEAVSQIVLYQPDIVFLDIKMPGKSGFEVLDDLKEIKTVNPYIVFTTAYDEYAIRAFEYAAFDYLLKPIDPKRLNETLLRVIGNPRAATAQNAEMLLDNYKKLIYRNISGIVIIDPSEIMYISAEGNYSEFFLSTGRTETVTILLGKVEEQLPPGKFFRTGRACIINIDYLKKINSLKHQCILYNSGKEYECEISRDRIKLLSDKLRDLH
jgi:DNA-binding LytR/AlgR family response regulator